MQLLDKLRTKHRFWGVSIDVLSGAGASLALPPLFILPALFLLCIPVWQAIHAPSRLAAARIFGAAGLGWFLASTFWVSHALIVEASSLWVLTPFVALGLAFILALFWAVTPICRTPRRPAKLRMRQCRLKQPDFCRWIIAC